MQEVAQLKKQYSQSLEALTNQRNEMDTFYQNAQQTGLREPTPPSREQFETDPIGYMDLKMKYDEEKAAYDQQVQEFENLRSQKLQAEQQRLDEFTQDQAGCSLKEYQK